MRHIADIIIPDEKMATSSASSNPKGGIDFNSDQLILKEKGDAPDLIADQWLEGFPDEMIIEGGLVPVIEHIQKIVPAQLPMLLGMKT